MTDVYGYAQALPLYRAAGWTQVIPLPEAAKFPPPKGTTGSTQQPVTDAQTAQWAQCVPNANTGIVLPSNVIVLDVDSAQGHAGKTDGAASLNRLERELGELPATWCSSAHGASSPYRHRIYRVPAGMVFDGGAAPGIDILQHHHRYAVVWPSVHPSGEQYHWYAPDGREYESVPHIERLPMLPEAWVERLRKRERPTSERRVNPMPMPTVRMGDDPRMCRAINTYLRRLLGATGMPGGRHDGMLKAAWALVRFQEEGHRGALDALAQLKPEFIRQVASDRRGGEREAEREYTSIVATALAKNTGVQGVSDPCDLSPVDRMLPGELNPAVAPTPVAPVQPVAEAGAQPPQTEQAGPQPAQPAPAVSSWRFEDLTELASGHELPPTPTVFTREDGQGLFYRGAVNDLHGEPGCGKSLVMQAACAQELKANHDVIYIDYEDSARNVVKRLLLMGVTGEAITSRLHYVRPSARPNSPTSLDGWRETLDYAATATLAVIDGVTSCLAYQGLDSNSGDDIAAWYNTMPRLIGARGPAVVLIDHVVKSKDNRGRYAGGSMQKLALIDGISYSVDMTRPVGRGVRGTIVIKSGKDRISEIEEHCAAAWAGGGSHLREAARIEVNSTSPDRMLVTVCRPNMMPVAETSARRDVFRPTGLMERISEIVADSGELGFNELMGELKADGSGARRSTVKAAAGMLVGEGYLASRVGANNKATYSSRRRYLQVNDPQSDRFEDRMECDEMEEGQDDLGIDDF